MALGDLEVKTRTKIVETVLIINSILVALLTANTILFDSNIVTLFLFSTVILLLYYVFARCRLGKATLSALAFFSAALFSYELLYIFQKLGASTYSFIFLLLFVVLFFALIHPDYNRRLFKNIRKYVP